MSKLNLTVEMDALSGYCFGVVNAIKKAEEALKHEKKVYCLGQIVHNEAEVKRMESLGMELINHEQLKGLKNTTVLFRAHGEPPASYKTAFYNNLHLMDASCPIILRLQLKIGESYRNNENIYIYGQPDHPEVIALCGQANGEAIAFEHTDKIIDSLPAEITLFSQTTKNLGKFYEIVEQIKKAGVKVKVHDTICREVSNRHEELMDFCSKYNVVVFVSGKKSSNGKMLFESCKKANPYVQRVSDETELNQAWFSQNQKVGVCGATSTPVWVMRKVKSAIESF